jgi:hypothetical protein
MEGAQVESKIREGDEMKNIMIGFALLLVVRTVGAEVLLHEGFDYPGDGANPESGLTGRDGGIGFAGPWLPPQRHPVNTLLPFGVHDNGLSYTRKGVSLEVSGRCVYSQMMIPIWTHDQQTRSMQSLGIGVPGNTRWFSALIQLADVEVQQRPTKKDMGWWALASFSGEDNGFGKQSTDFKWGMHYKARPDVRISGKEKIQYGQTTLLVMKVIYGEKKQTNTLWVNPTPAVDGSITIPPEVPAVRATPMVLSIMSDELILNSSCQGYLDEIRVGTTYHDVAPGWQGIGPQGTLQFSPASYTADEMGGRVAVTVTRIGGSAGPASVSIPPPPAGRPLPEWITRPLRENLYGRRERFRRKHFL